MKKTLVIMVAVLLLAASAAAGKAAPTGSIQINQPGPYAFQDVVTFTTSASGLKGTQYPMVYVECRSVVDDEVLYGQLDHPNVSFVLGGGSSPWWQDRDDTHCTATLYAYGGKGQTPYIVQLGTPVTFDAAG
jgi:hypothetical protein